jgi:type I restriction enzyme R subunit
VYPATEEDRAKLALDLDLAVREGAPAGWKSDSEGPRGIQVMNALYPLLSRDRQATKAVYEIIKQQPGY